MSGFSRFRAALDGVSGLGRGFLAAKGGLKSRLQAVLGSAAVRPLAQAGNEAGVADHLWEALRFNPVNPILYRRAATATRIGDTEVAANSMVLAANSSAMFDEETVEQPTHFIAGRPWSIYALWGGGLPLCWGDRINKAVLPAMLTPLPAKRGLRQLAAPDGRGTPFPCHHRLAWDRRLQPLRLLLLLWAGPALAAGGTHIVDDSAVETPGLCNTELFGKYFGPGRWSGTANLNCTFKTAPRLELGVGLVRTQERDGQETAIGPAFKWNLAEPTGGSPGLALVGAMKLATETGRIESATLFVPVTFAVSDGLALSLNLGWQHVRLADTPNTATFGAQLDAAVAERLGLMIEAFATLEDQPGAQAGLRWTPVDALDLDLTLGHKVDGVSDLSLAIGAVLRF